MNDGSKRGDIIWLIFAPKLGCLIVANSKRGTFAKQQIQHGARSHPSSKDNWRRAVTIRMVDICTMSQKQLSIFLQGLKLGWVAIHAATICPDLNHLVNDIGTVRRIQYLRCNRWMRQHELQKRCGSSHGSHQHLWRCNGHTHGNQLLCRWQIFPRKVIIQWIPAVGR